MSSPSSATVSDSLRTQNPWNRLPRANSSLANTADARMPRRSNCASILSAPSPMPYSAIGRVSSCNRHQTDCSTDKKSIISPILYTNDIYLTFTAGRGTPEWLLLPYGDCLIQSAEWILCQPDKTDAQCAPLQYFTWYSIINQPEHRICFLPTIIRKPSADCKAKILPLSPLRFSLRSYIIILVNERCVVLCPNRTVFWQ